jgi:aspartate ammonia-lyase
MVSTKGDKINLEEEWTKLEGKHSMLHNGVKDFAELFKRLGHTINMEPRTIMKINVRTTIGTDLQVSQRYVLRVRHHLASLTY